MIEHYALHAVQDLTDRFGLTDGVPKGVKPRYNVSPAQSAPVVIRSGATTELRMMSWGLVSQGAKDTNSVFRYKTFNTKSEKVFAKPSWDSAVRHQRCIIPANGFFMIRSDGGGAYYFTHPDTPLMPLAGIYSSWTDAAGAVQHSYSLLTIEANRAMPLPFGRMPVVLHDQDESAWLDTDTQDFGSLVRMMRPYESAILDYWKVSADVASAKIDAPALIERI